MDKTSMGLPQWEKQDPWLINDFNQALEKVDEDFAERGINPKWFNASFSYETVTVDTQANSQRVSLLEPGDFKNDQYIAIYGAGPLPDFIAPNVSISNVGTKGTTSYIYQVAAIDFKGGMSAASPAVSTTQGIAALNSTSYNQITWDAVEGALAYAVYGRSAGNVRLLGVTQQLKWSDFGGPFIVDPPFTLPQTAPTVPRRNVLVAKIESGAGTRVLTLDRSPEESLSGVMMYHDDTIPIQAAIDYAQQTSKQVIIPQGKARITEPLITYTGVSIRGSGVLSEINTNMPFINLIEAYSAISPDFRSFQLVGSGFGTQPPNTQGDPKPQGSGSGIVLLGCISATIDLVSIQNCGGNGDSSERNGVAGVWLTYGCEKCLVRADVKKCRNAINEDNYYGAEPFHNTVYGGIIEDCRFGAVTDCADQARGFKVLDCTFIRCAYGGVDVNKTSHVKIKGCRFEECGYTGIPGVTATALNVYGTANFRAEFVEIEGCTFYNNYGRALKFVQNTQFCSAADIKISGSKSGGGILLQATRYYNLSEIIITDCVGTGIHFNPVKINNVDIGIDQGVLSDIIIRHCTQHGLYISKGLHITLSKIRVNECGLEAPNTYSGIALDNETTNCTLEACIVTGPNHRFGIGGLDSGSVNNTIGLNNVHGNVVNIGFVSNQQHWVINGDNRRISGFQVDGSVDVKTNNGKLYLPDTTSAEGEIPGELRLKYTDKRILANFDGQWYQSPAFTKI